MTMPSKCVAGMYNDMRYARNTPLKEYMFIRFREPLRERDCLGLFFDMGCERYGCGIRIYGQTSAGMARIRESVRGDGRAYARALENLEQSGINIYGVKYAKDRFPEIADKMLNNFLNYRSFHVGRDCMIGESVYDGRLRDEIAETFLGLKELYLLLRKSLYES